VVPVSRLRASKVDVRVPDGVVTVVRFEAAS
jgi:hypothetical protein